MKKWILVLFMVLPLIVMSSMVNAASVSLDKANIDLADKASLQHGAKLFMNYCFACHSMKYQRYERVANDLDIPIAAMKKNLIFDRNTKIGDLMVNSMSAKQGVTWFGTPPPDLTLVARVRGADWLYTYLRSFYADPSRPFGVNNMVFPNVAMPHVLEALQGKTTPIYANQSVAGKKVQTIVGVKNISAGTLTQDEYNQVSLDLVNFLVYSGDPVQLERHALGWWVMGFLVIFLIVVVLLKKEYWRDIH